MKTLVILFVALFAFSLSVNAQSLKAKDLKALEGGMWTGQLTYLDYSGNGKRITIKSNVDVAKKPDTENAWVFAYTYPDEPKANSTGDVLLADDGKMFNGQTVVEKKKLSGGLEVITTKEGDDSGKKALFRYTYTITPKTFSIRKETQYVGTTAWFERNTYSWSR